MSAVDLTLFRPVQGYEQYLVSEDGLVYSTKSRRLLTLHTNNKGYKYVSFSMGSKHSNKNFLVSRLVCFMFGDLPSLASELEVNHKDYNKSNNSLSNLEVMSFKEHREKTILDRKLRNNSGLEERPSSPSS